MYFNNKHWVEMPGFNGRYYACKEGVILSVNYKRTGKMRELRPLMSKDGYVSVSLRVEGRDKRFKIHRLIAQSFIDNPENKEQVNHKNFNRTDNDLSNLEWATAKENNNHARYRRKSNKLNEGKVLEIRDKYRPHIYTRKDLAKEYGVSVGCINHVVDRTEWKHI